MFIQGKRKLFRETQENNDFSAHVLYKGHLELFQEDQNHSNNIRALEKFLAFPCFGSKTALFTFEYKETET